MISIKSMANVAGGKKTRACDSCVKKRATWYCAADDVFLCQACDSSVHSANPLARRHERVRLKTDATGKSFDLGLKEDFVPSWHQGFIRKARTPRHSKSHSKVEETYRNPFLLVPEVGSDEISLEENEQEHLLYRVPFLDPLVAELCTSTTDSNEAGSGTPAANGIQSKPSLPDSGVGQDGECLQAFLQSDMEIEEFAADVESLLGRGLENESFMMEDLGLIDCREEELHENNTFQSRKKVKIEGEEEEEEEEADMELVDIDQIDIAKEPPSELSFDYDSDDKKIVTGKKDFKSTGENESDYAANKTKRKKLLSLDYEAVITAWSSGGSPWANGNMPDFDPARCWHDCTGTCGTQFRHPRDTACVAGNPATEDGGREARVSRYREKRRTRLFSKKIRYEVRKLNAEKRPRMKGRFVKRTFAAPAFSMLK